MALHNGKYMGIGIALGIAIGSALGIAFENPALWIAICVGIGAALGFALSKSKNNTIKTTTDVPQKEKGGKNPAPKIENRKMPLRQEVECGQRICAEVSDIRKDLRLLGVGQTEPFRKRRGVLIDRSRRYPAAA